MRSAVIACCLAFTTGCTETVMVRTNPPGAHAWLNGNDLGMTPAIANVDYTAFSSYELRLEKEGYQPYNGHLTTEVNIGSLIIGVVICWPALIWVVQPSPEQSFDLVPVAGPNNSIVTAPSGGARDNGG